jgi:hypothetical protein
MAISSPKAHQVIDLDHLPPKFGEPPLRWPDLDDLDLDQITVTYDEPYDLLSVHLLGHPVPAVNMPLDTPDSARGYAEARIGIPSGEVVGIHITGYRTEVCDLHPLWRNLPDLTGEARRVALRVLIETIAAMPVYDGPPN